MTVSDQIIEVLNALCEKFGIALDWGNENIIPYVMTLGEKLVNYEIMSSAVMIFIACIMTVISIVLIKVFYPIFKAGWKANEQSHWDCGWQVSGTLAMIGLGIFYIWVFLTFIFEIFDIIQCLTFPELYIFEYIQCLINSGS